MSHASMIVIINLKTAFPKFISIKKQKMDIIEKQVKTPNDQKKKWLEKKIKVVEDNVF